MLARNIMEGILRDLEAGKPFQVPEITFFSASAPKAEGGELGLFTLDELAPQLQDALKDKKTGEFSKILESDFGYQIVFVEDIIDIAGTSLEEATPEIQGKLYKEVVDRKFESWLKLLRDQSHIKIIN
jgi:parvulin-like peptidyl-prolyl isomerase